MDGRYDPRRHRRLQHGLVAFRWFLTLISNSCMRNVTGFTEHVSQRSRAESRAVWG